MILYFQVPFRNESRNGLLYNLYDGLLKARVLTSHMKSQLHSIKDRDPGRSLYRAAVVLEQGNGHSGVRSLLCKMFMTFTQQVAFNSYDLGSSLVPERLNSNGNPSSAIDVAFLCFRNVENLMKAMKNELEFYMLTHNIQRID